MVGLHGHLPRLPVMGPGLGSMVSFPSAIRKSRYYKGKILTPLKGRVNLLSQVGCYSSLPSLQNRHGIKKAPAVNGKFAWHPQAL